MTAYASLTLDELLARHPYAGDFFASLGLTAPAALPLDRYFRDLDEDVLEDVGLGREELLSRFEEFMAAMADLAGEAAEAVESVTVLGGRDKSGRPERMELVLRPGQVTCIVGPTGSGKSRLLADIEWLAQGDTPTGRRILVNGQVPDPARRYAVDRKLVAQLSQNMNFVMDLTVAEFVAMHAESRMLPAGVKTDEIIALANELAGERFSPDTALTSLSGGQSRALMIADVSCLSASPIVLIDEIENAGIDRRKALDLLADKGKIVLMATHDPILALLGDRRLVFKNGGVAAILETSPEERAHLGDLEAMDARLTAIRNALRNGERIDRLGEA